MMRRFANGGMIDDKEIEARCEIGQCGVSELLERAFLPEDVNVGMQLAKTLRCGLHRQQPARVVPSHAGKRGCRFVGAHATARMLRWPRRSQLECSASWNQVKAMEQKLFFEDYVVGSSRQSTGRTITEADVVLHAGQTGDFYPHHMDAEWCRAQPFERRIAHGTLIFSVGVGMTAGEINPLAMSYGYDRLRFIKPVFLNDTIRAKVTVSEKRDHPKRGTHGIVVEALEVTNQRGEVVLVAEHLLLVERSSALVMA